jgi:hypothetical protein
MVRLLHQHPELDWDYIFKEYKHSDLQRMIFLGLIVAHDLVEAALPQEILQQARRDPLVAGLALEVKERLFLNQGEQEGLRFTWFQLRLKSSWVDRVRYCYRVASTPTILEWNVALPEFLFPFYFVLRPIRLLRKYLSRLISSKV